MKREEFDSLLKKANSLKSLSELRNGAASAYVCRIKEKLEILLPRKGWTKTTISMSSLKNYTNNTDANSLTVIKTGKSQTFPQNSKVKIYVNAKYGSRWQMVEVWYKEVKR